MDGYDFKIIQSHYDLLMEGIEMRHCVEMFHKRINRSSYVVFAVKRSHSDPADKANRFTLGLVVVDGLVSLDQCKGVYNARIDMELRNAVDELILALNTGRIELMRTESVAIA